MTRHAESVKSGLSRLKLGWLALLLAMMVILYSYIHFCSHFRRVLPSQQHERSDTSTRGGDPLNNNSVAENSTSKKEYIIHGDWSTRCQNPQGFQVNPVMIPNNSVNVFRTEEYESNFNSAEDGLRAPGLDDQVEPWLEIDELYDGLRNRTTPWNSIIFFKSLKRLTNHSNPHCAITTPFSSWEKGVVTQLGILIKRDCHKLRTNPEAEMKEKNLQFQVKLWRSAKPWERFAFKYKEKSCDQIRAEFENNFYVSKVEKNFPIAYILVVYTNAGQILRLLKAIYRPHNLYCIHPDVRQGQEFTDYFKVVAKCLDNVFIVSKPVRVYYGHISITDSQLHCMQDLMTSPNSSWKYVINLCGREVPLRTNREIVESLVKLKGYTALQTISLSTHFRNKRFRFKFHIGQNGIMMETHQQQSKPPEGIKLYKSMNFIAASWEFVSFLLNDPISLKLHDYLESAYAPEEHFYSSLYHLPQAKCARPPKGVIHKNDMPFVDMFIWVNTLKMVKNLKLHCPGQKSAHGICILTASDLGRIEKLGIQNTKPVFFFNKYFLEWDPTAMECMEERLVTTNLDEYKRDCVPTHVH